MRLERGAHLIAGRRAADVLLLDRSGLVVDVRRRRCCPSRPAALADEVDPVDGVLAQDLVGRSGREECLGLVGCQLRLGGGSLGRDDGLRRWRWWVIDVDLALP
jgi:hypothetical protein